MLAGGQRQYRRGRASRSPTSPCRPGRLRPSTRRPRRPSLAVDRGNPSEPGGARPPQRWSSRPEWWTPEQVVIPRLHRRQPCSSPARRDAGRPGGRRGQVLGLRWQDLDSTRASTVVQQLVTDPRTKGLSLRPTKRPRPVARLHPATVAVLKRRRVEQAEERLAMGAGWPSADSSTPARAPGPMVGHHPDVVTRTVSGCSAAKSSPATPTACATRHRCAQGEGARRGRAARLGQHGAACRRSTPTSPGRRQAAARRGDLYEPTGLARPVHDPADVGKHGPGKQLSRLSHPAAWRAHVATVVGDWVRTSATGCVRRGRRGRRKCWPEWSGCRDLNSGPLDPQSSALTKLRHSPWWWCGQPIRAGQPITPP